MVTHSFSDMAMQLLQYSRWNESNQGSLMLAQIGCCLLLYLLKLFIDNKKIYIYVYKYMMIQSTLWSSGNDVGVFVLIGVCLFSAWMNISPRGSLYLWIIYGCLNCRRQESNRMFKSLFCVSRLITACGCTITPMVKIVIEVFGFESHRRGAYTYNHLCDISRDLTHGHFSVTLLPRFLGEGHLRGTFGNCCDVNI